MRRDAARAKRRRCWTLREPHTTQRSRRSPRRTTSLRRASRSLEAQIAEATKAAESAVAEPAGRRRDRRARCDADRSSGQGGPADQEGRQFAGRSVGLPDG
ncbi:hypothetical protein [Nocardioides convexus]|uniref:hypothetical protein n=1 Tax=Nocardioides convexus TaxID=2712224 RepID=UPI002418B1E7|nr:hypothetical protein [Nocardioides convexus]